MDKWAHRMTLAERMVSDWLLFNIIAILGNTRVRDLKSYDVDRTTTVIELIYQLLYRCLVSKKVFYQAGLEEAHSGQDVNLYIQRQLKE